MATNLAFKSDVIRPMNREVQSAANVAVRTRSGRVVRERIEKGFFERTPGYALLRSLTQQVAGDNGQKNVWKPAFAATISSSHARATPGLALRVVGEAEEAGIRSPLLRDHHSGAPRARHVDFSNNQFALWRGGGLVRD